METTISPLQPEVDGQLQGEQTSLDVAAEQYLASKAKTGGNGNYTHTASWTLTEFVDEMLDRNVTTTGHLDKHDLTAYAGYLKQEVAKPDRERKLSAESAQTYYNIVAGFLGWCVRRDLLDTNFARKDIATDELPNAEGSEKQQFWSDSTRENLLLYVDWKTEDVIRNGWMDEQKAVRDRAYIGLLALTGVRNGELLRSPRDDRRNGLRWGDIDFENGIVYVLGKSQDREEVPLLDRAARWVRAHERRLDPPSDDWPVFPTGHAPSRYSAASDGLQKQGHTDNEVEAVLSDTETGTVLRKYGITPPAMTTEGGRTILQDVSQEAHILEDGELLQPHGARRGVGQAYYMQEGHESAQKVLRHQDPAVTSKQYSHLETSELREAGERILGDNRRSGGNTEDDVPEGSR